MASASQGKAEQPAPEELEVWVEPEGLEVAVPVGAVGREVAPEVEAAREVAVPEAAVKLFVTNEGISAGRGAGRIFFNQL